MDKLKSAGAWMLGIFAIAAVTFLAVGLARGTASLSEWVLPKLVPVATYATYYLLPLLALLAIPRSTRGVAGAGLLAASYFYGVTLWVLGLVVTLANWGWVAVIVGLFLGGVGVVPIAILAAIVKGLWPLLGVLLLGCVLTFGTRMVGAVLAEVSARRPALDESPA